jgi:hypothetical protein
VKAVRRFGPVAVLVALPSILYAPFLFGGKVLYWGVYLLQFYPWRQLAVEQIRAGQWPLWNPYLGGGTPLAANLQTAAFYPLNLLFLLMPVERAFGWELALHVTLAGLFAYYLGRTLGLSRFGSLIAGMAYGLGGYLIARWVFPTMVCAAAWLPLMLALVEKQVASSKWQDRVRSACLLALVIALQLLAGHAQTSFYSLVIIGAFGLFRIAQQAASSKLQVRRGLLAASSLLVAALLGAALASIQLLPTAEFVAHSQRAGTLTDLQFAYELSFWPWRLITLLAPDFFGNPARGGYWAYGTYWEEAAYAGIVPVLLAALATAAWWRHRKAKEKSIFKSVPFFAILAAVSVLLALGNHTPIYPLVFRYVPGFGLFQAPARLMIGYAMAIPVLAGIGADSLPSGRRIRAALRTIVVGGLGIGLAGGFALIALPTLQASFGQSTTQLGVTLTVAGIVLLARGRRLGQMPWQLLVALLVVADLLVFGWGLAPATDPAVYRSPVATAEFLRSQPPGRVFTAEPYAGETYDRYVSLSDSGLADLAFLQGLRESLLPNLSAPFHLAAAGNYDPLTVGRYRELWDRLGGQGEDPAAFEKIRRLLNLLGVRYVVTDRDLDLPLIYDGGPRIYRNDGALPEAFVAGRARAVEDEDKQIATLVAPTFDPKTEVVLEQPAPLPVPAAQLGKVVGTVDSREQAGANRVTLKVNMTGAGYLVLTDTYYPGWQVIVDDQPAEIQRADYVYQAVALDAGEHTVEFRYRPRSFELGAWITLGAAVLLIVGLAFGALRGWRRQGIAILL